MYGVHFGGEAWGMMSSFVGRPGVWCPAWWRGLVYGVHFGGEAWGMVSSFVGGLGYGIQFCGEAWSMVSSFMEKPGVWCPVW